MIHNVLRGGVKNVHIQNIQVAFIKCGIVMYVCMYVRMYRIKLYLTGITLM